MLQDLFTQSSVRTMAYTINNNRSLITVDHKVAVITVHDVNPPHSEKYSKP
ncbi:MAG TPA: hypothetical protein VFS97_04005 [Nitrososphaeraceae archaeon]|nr:hypothetical protein [Nitrososphaeraceae archaeon]